MPNQSNQSPRSGQSFSGTLSHNNNLHQNQILKPTRIHAPRLASHPAPAVGAACYCTRITEQSRESLLQCYYIRFTDMLLAVSGMYQLEKKRGWLPPQACVPGRPPVEPCQYQSAQSSFQKALSHNTHKLLSFHSSPFI